MSKQFNVCAVFGEGRSMKTAVCYAGRLAALLSVKKLHVYLPGKGNPVTTRPLVVAGIQRQRIEQRLLEWQKHPVEVHDDIDLTTATAEQLPPNSIIVSNGLALKRPDLTVLQPFEESEVLRASGSILVPFGDGDSGALAASVAIPLAQAMSLEVLFYHTTWPSAEIQSSDPVDHMCSNSRRHLEGLAKMANDAGVAHRMAVEMADDVVFGMLNCALNGDVDASNPRPVNLIVMAHGVNTHIGSYVEKALKVSATPILVVTPNFEESVSRPQIQAETAAEQSDIATAALTPANLLEAASEAEKGAVS